MSRYIPVHDATDSLTKMRHIEVDQEANRMATQFEVGEQLSEMQGKQFFNRLQFNDDAVFDKVVDPIASLEADAAVCDRQTDLVLKMQSVHVELVMKTGVVGALQQTSAERGVNLHCSLEDSFCEVLMEHR